MNLIRLVFILFFSIISIPHCICQTNSKIIRISQWSGHVVPRNGIGGGQNWDRLDSMKVIIDYLQSDIYVIQSFYQKPEITRFKNEVIDSINYPNFTLAMPNYDSLNSQAFNEVVFYDSSKMDLIDFFGIEDTAFSHYNYTAYNFLVYDSANSYPLTLIANTRGTDSDCSVCDDFRKTNLARFDTLLELFDSLGTIVFTGEIGFTGTQEIDYQYAIKEMKYKFFDLLDANGSWRNSNIYWYGDSLWSFIHNSSIRNSSFDAGDSRGISFRSSVIFGSEPLMTGRYGLKYIQGSYRIVGNDGQRVLGGSLLDGPSNLDIGDQLANTLYHCGNHLPITIEIELDADFTPMTSIEKELEEKWKIISPTLDSRLVFIYKNKIETFSLTNFNLTDITGRTVHELQLNVVNGVNTVELPILKSGIYFLTLNDDQFYKRFKVLIKN